jgi:LEA14-like dessication related protein
LNEVPASHEASFQVTDDMTIRKSILLAGITSVIGCTPLGLWVYDDPSVTVARVRLAEKPSAKTPVLIALEVRNPNDYDISTVEVELLLRLDDVQIGELSRDSTVPLPKGTTSTVEVPLVPNRGPATSRLESFLSGPHRFAIRGRAQFATPFGKRKVRFAQEGQIVFDRSPS